jgi:hypothetical protein
MTAALLARLLFSLALIGQILSASTANLRGATAVGPSVCGHAHAATQANAASPATDQAPKNDPSHRHGVCAYCELDAGGPPLHTRLSWLEAPPPRDVERLPLAYAATLVPFQINRNAPARASPALS